MDRPVMLGEFLEMKDWMLTHFATKEDFERFATKEDLERFATKEDLSKLSHRVDKGFDFLFGAYQDLKQEQIFTNQALKRIEAKLGI